LEEELFKSRERIIEISIEKDHLFDSVSGLELQLHVVRKELRKTKKKLNQLYKLHVNCNCNCGNTVLYR